ncbi:MAG: type II toxin-antitoxin system VapC family toxin [Candidatus Aminicenantes bacterium]|nr:type II toxin-antitoxin system VapC family toxin [Candidatus Aminicenantes bacterium]
MSDFVLDASIAAAWLFDDESAPSANSLLKRLREWEAVVPQHWHLEVRNALIVGERRGRIRPDEVDERLIDLGTLPVRTDLEPDFDAALRLSRFHRLSFYDAVYLELARRQGLPLATLDADLGAAAVVEGVGRAE